MEECRALHAGAGDVNLEPAGVCCQEQFWLVKTFLFKTCAQGNFLEPHKFSCPFPLQHPSSAEVRHTDCVLSRTRTSYSAVLCV